MAGLIIAVKDLEHLIQRVTPAVEEHTKGIVERREAEYTKYNARLDRAKEVVCDAVIRQRADERLRKLNKDLWPWQMQHQFKAMYEQEKVAAQHAARNRAQLVREEFMMRHREDDHITPVLNYLSAQIKRLDPCAKIMLTDKETFQMTKAMELAGVDYS